MNFPPIIFEEYLDALEEVMDSTEGFPELRTINHQGREISILSLRDLETIEEQNVFRSVLKKHWSSIQNHTGYKKISKKNKLLIKMAVIGGHLQEKAYPIWMEECCIAINNSEYNMAIHEFLESSCIEHKESSKSKINDWISIIEEHLTFDRNIQNQHQALIDASYLNRIYNHTKDLQTAIEIYKKTKDLPEDSQIVFGQIGSASTWLRLFHTIFDNPPCGILSTYIPDANCIDALQIFINIKMANKVSIRECIYQIAQLITTNNITHENAINHVIYWMAEKKHHTNGSNDLSPLWNMHLTLCEGLGIPINIQNFIKTIPPNNQQTDQYTL